MTSTTVAAPEPCPACGGKGTKLLTLRRSAAAVAETTERGPARRERVTCLACGGTGETGGGSGQ